MKNFLGVNAEHNMDLCDFFKSKIGDDSSSVYCMVNCLDVSLPKISIIPNLECINIHTSEEGPLCISNSVVYTFIHFFNQFSW